MEKAIRQMIRALLKEPKTRNIIDEELVVSQESANPFGENSDLKSSYKTSLRRIVINEDGHILLSGCKILRVEIPNGYSRMIYILYLLSPSGISNSELKNYKKEMMKIFDIISNFSCKDQERTERAIEGLLNRKGAINDANNKIKRAFRKVISDNEILPYYTIEGKRLGKRKILLPKSLIIIENDELIQVKNMLDKQSKKH